MTDHAILFEARITYNAAKPDLPGLFRGMCAEVVVQGGVIECEIVSTAPDAGLFHGDSGNFTGRAIIAESLLRYFTNGTPIIFQADLGTPSEGQITELLLAEPRRESGSVASAACRFPAAGILSSGNEAG